MVWQACMAGDDTNKGKECKAYSVYIVVLWKGVVYYCIKDSHEFGIINKFQLCISVDMFSQLTSSH